MTKRTALPDPFTRYPFTQPQAVSASVSRGRLRASDLTKLSRMIYLPAGTEPELIDRVRAHLAVTPEAWVSHQTAAAIHNMPVPPRLADHDLLHLSKPYGLPRVRRRGVVGHEVRFRPSELCHLEGMRISAPARTWLDLAMQLPHEHLVALGDHLLRVPRPGLEGRGEPYATKESLVEMLSAHPKMKGVVRCRLALEDMRVGADSVPETLLRLAIIYAGLPEPELQVTLVPDDPFSPSGDLGYREFKIVIQYEGAHHDDEGQRLADARRDRAFRRGGWIVIHVRLDDLREDFRGVIRRISAAIGQRAA